MDFELVIPVAPAHINLFDKHIGQIIKYVNPVRTTVIANGAFIGEVKNKYPHIHFMNEDELDDTINMRFLRDYLQNRIGVSNRAGSYMQQFIKMVYAFKSQTPLYLTWDIDTIPHKPLSFFDEEKILFSYTDEYHVPYFDTMKRLFNMHKSFSKSFIAEHLMIDRDIMKEIVVKLQNVDLAKHWLVNGMDAVDDEFIGHSGFSEFETYGTYVFHNYKDRYKPRYFWHNRYDSKKISIRLYKKFISDIFDTSSFEVWAQSEIKLRRFKRFYKDTLERKKNFKLIEW